MVKQSDYRKMQPDELLNVDDIVYASTTGHTPFTKLVIRRRLKTETTKQHKDYIRIMKKYRSEGILYKKVNSK